MTHWQNTDWVPKLLMQPYCSRDPLLDLLSHDPLTEYWLGTWAVDAAIQQSWPILSCACAGADGRGQQPGDPHGSQHWRLHQDLALPCAADLACQLGKRDCHSRLWGPESHLCPHRVLVQNRPRIHWRVHLPVDEVAGQESVPEWRNVPQVDWRLVLKRRRGEFCWRLVLKRRCGEFCWRLTKLPCCMWCSWRCWKQDRVPWLGKSFQSLLMSLMKGEESYTLNLALRVKKQARLGW